MNTYKCYITGYKKNVPEVLHNGEITLIADTADQAHIKLYDTYSNILQYSVKNIGNENDFKNSKYIH